jgi:hypothetical protein
MTKYQSHQFIVARVLFQDKSGCRMPELVRRYSQPSVFEDTVRKLGAECDFSLRPGA